MELIILVGHGSPNKQANTMDEVGKALHGKLHPGCSDKCVRVAYLSHGEPSISEAIDTAAEDRATDIVIHPYFLGTGMHVTKSIPSIIKEAQKRHPSINFIYTAPLGITDEIIQVAINRISEAKGN